jgi:hypothetical protein
VEKCRLVVGEEEIVPVGVVNRVDYLDVHGKVQGSGFRVD